MSAFRELVRDCGHYGERRTMHHCRAEAPHEPRARPVVGKPDEIDDVLDHREAGADREPGDDRVELVADAVHPEERHDCEALDRLLDPRRDEPAIIREANRKRVEQAAADRPRQHGRESAHRQQDDDLAKAHQLERVEPVEHGKQHQDGDDCEAPMRGLDQKCLHRAT